MKYKPIKIDIGAVFYASVSSRLFLYIYSEHYGLLILETFFVNSFNWSIERNIALSDISYFACKR